MVSRVYRFVLEFGVLGEGGTPKAYGRLREAPLW